MADQTSLFFEHPLPEFAPGVPQEHLVHGHREALRARLMRSGEASLEDAELLELILFRAVRRREVRTLARRLLERFGDFNRVLAATPAQLREVHDVGVKVIRELKIVEAAGHRMAQTRVLNAPVISSWQALLDYCKARMAHLQVEQFRVLYLDRKNVLIADEAQSGTVNHVPVFPREVVKRALELNASALILAHNHPSGQADPSEEDIAMTERMVAAAEALEITVHDHLIIGMGEPYSFRSNRLI